MYILWKYLKQTARCNICNSGNVPILQCLEVKAHPDNFLMTTCSVSQNPQLLHGQWTQNVCFVSLWIKDCIAWQHCGIVSQGQSFRNAPQHRDGVWSLISRTPATRALSVSISHSPSQMHAGEASNYYDSFKALDVFLALN